MQQQFKQTSSYLVWSDLNQHLEQPIRLTEAESLMFLQLLQVKY